LGGGEPAPRRGRCFVAGGYGFIGRHIVAALVANGWEVVAGGRELKRARRLMPDVTWVAVDFNHDLDADVWRKRLAGCSALVNCAGVLQSGWRDRSRRVHVDATLALFRGAAAAGVERIVHLSALGADAAGKTAFARDKAAADAALAEMDVDAVVLRPSLVYARDSYGGTAFMRALAGLPGVIPIPAGIAFDPIHADDLATIVARCLDRDAVASRLYEIGGPQRMSLQEIVAEMRRWLGFPSARYVSVPTWLMRPLLWLGDIAGWLGNPSALRSTTIVQAYATPPARSNALIKATKVRPRPMRVALAAEPASVADRLHARLGFVGPALRITLGAFWIASGLVALLPPTFEAALTIAAVAGFRSPTADALIYAGAALDILLGLPMLVGVKVRPVALLQAALTAVYVAVIGVLIPDLWTDPLGALVKPLPLIVASLAVAAMAEDR
jgi:uncharacterized protein YbjT (DUF2867 family)